MSQPNTGEKQKEAARELVSVNAYSAGTVFDSFQQSGYETTDAANVTAVLDGLGAAKADPALAQFVNAGHDAKPSDSDTSNPVQKNLKYTMNKEGINATYDQDGKNYSILVE